MHGKPAQNTVSCKKQFQIESPQRRCTSPECPLCDLACCECKSDRHWCNILGYIRSVSFEASQYPQSCPQYSPRQHSADAGTHRDTSLDCFCVLRKLGQESLRYLSFQIPAESAGLPVLFIKGVWSSSWHVLS